jgi:uncharacterized OB-fold protein
LAEYIRPLPVPDGDTKPYWDAAREHRLVIQRCQACQQAIFYPRSLCPHCMSDQIAWIDASGTGTIYSFTVVHRAPAQFAEDAPYVVALIDLAEGVRLMSSVVDCAPSDVRIGARVEVTFDDVTPEITLPKFRLSLAGV